MLSAFVPVVLLAPRTWPLALLIGCAASRDPATCRALDAGPARDGCFAAIAADVADDDPRRAQTAAAEIADVDTRDFTFFSLTRADPTTSRWCAQIQDVTLAQRCMVLVNRPHLHPDRRAEEKR